VTILSPPVMDTAYGKMLANEISSTTIMFYFQITRPISDKFLIAAIG